MQIRIRTWMSALVLAGCVVPANNPPPPPGGYGPPPPQYTQQQPPPSEPAPQPYEPPPQQYQPPPQPDPSYQPPPPTPPADPPPPSYSDPVYTDINVEVAGNDVPSVDVFYDQLSPYGTWYDDPTYGWVFAPGDPSYLPYTNGRWSNTEYGFTWISNDPFGWATDHYGRWVWANRWVWRPDTTWGPAWVQWREGDGYVGWAPAGYSDDAYFPEDHWRFVPATYLFAEAPRYIIRSNVRGYVRSTWTVRRYGNDRHRRTWVLGPDDDWLRRNRVEVRRERVELDRIGRFDDARGREAARRARERQREWDDRRRRDDQIRRDLEGR
ncbi:MAG TPA: DUF6600 domain-containing protein, partial [Kofleriaceae bacterium]